MKYREMAGEKISVLGFGCMRFPTTSKNAEDIDAEKSAKMLVYAIENGVNYFDTAYVCLLYTSPSPRDRQKSRMPSSA